MKRMTQILLLGWAVLSFASCAVYGSEPEHRPKAIRGVLDMTAWDFSTDGPLNLDGEWEFYSNQLLTPDNFLPGRNPPAPGYINVPSSWNSKVKKVKIQGGHGYGTYRLLVKTGKRDTVLGIKISKIILAYSLWINDRLISTAGRPAATRLAMKPELAVNSFSFAPEGESFHLLIQVSNFHHAMGGIRRSIVLGDERTVHDGRMRDYAFDLISLGCLFIMALYHFGLYFSRRKDTATLYFVGMCLVVALRIAMTGDMLIRIALPGLPWHLQVRMELCGFFLMVPIFIGFYQTLYPREMRRELLWTFWGIGLAMILPVLVSEPVYSRLIMAGYQLFLLAGGLSIIYGLVAAIRRGRENAILFMASFLIPFFIGINEIVYYQNFFPTVGLFRSGFFIFIISQALILSRTYGAALTTVEDQRGELQRMNITLEQEVRQRTEAEKELQHSQYQLEQRVRERTVELQYTNEILQREIENRARTEAALRESESRYRTLFESASEGILVAVIETREVVYANTAACALLGYPERELLGLTVMDVHPREYHETVFEFFNDMAAGGRKRTLHLPLLRKDGTTVSTSVSAAPAMIGARWCLIGFFSDITEQLAMEDALRRSEERYRALVTQSRDAIFFLNSLNAITFANPATLDIFGYPPRSFTAERQFVLGLVHPDYRETFNTYWGAYRKGGDLPVQTIEMAWVHRDGHTVYTDNLINVVNDEEGKILGIQIIARDISERKRIEADLIRKQKLESLGLVAGGIAHDFNNLLTAIMGNLSLARAIINPEDRLVEVLRDAEVASSRARDLTRQLVTLSKGGAPLRAPMPVQSLIRDNAEILLSGTEVGCDYSFAENLWNVLADPAQLSQVVYNLVINAQQAMSGGGTIYVTAANCVIGEAVVLPLKPGEYVKIAITDSGTGIPEDQINRIFDPYFTTKTSGSGLGLAVTYSIIKKHEGHIAVDSVPGAGSTFTIYLPATREGVAPASAPVAADGYRVQCKVLVMDDEENIRTVAGKMLARLGCSVIVASHGEEAVSLYTEALKANHPFDLVLMDLTVPGRMGGKEAIGLLRQIDPGVKAIVSSGYFEDPVLAKYRDFGFTGRIVKPFNYEELARVIRAVFPAAGEQ